MTDLWARSLGNMAWPIKRGGAGAEPAGRDKPLAAEANWSLFRPLAGSFGGACRR